MKNSSKLLFPIITFIFSILILGCKKDDFVTTVENTNLCLVEINGNFEEIEVDEIPVFLDGGDEGFAGEIGDAITYPAEARENGIEGVCLSLIHISEPTRPY